VPEPVLQPAVSEPATTRSDQPEAPTRAPRSQSTRRKARKRAIDILFESDLRGTDPLGTLAERTADADPPVRDFTADLVRGVVAGQDHIDDRLSENLAAGWTLGRLPRVDRAALRIAVHELDTAAVPADVIISEAVALVSELSTDDSPSFVNGVLGKIAAS